MRPLGVGLFVAALAASLPARADDTPLDRAAIEAELGNYYGGERATGFIAAGLGVASAGGGAFLVTRDSDFAKGLGWSLIGLGAIEAIGGVGYALSVNGREDHFRSLLARDESAFHREELDHIRGTMSRFVYYRIIELVLLVGGAGVATYGFVADKDVWKGVGIGVAAFALPIAVIDTINHARAGSYEDHLRRFVPRAGVQPASATRPMMFTLGGSF